MKKMICLLVLSFSSLALGQIKDPRDVIPQYTEKDFTKNGFLGDKPAFSEDTLMMLNYVNWAIARHERRQMTELDIISFGDINLTIEEAFDLVGKFMGTPAEYDADLFAYGQTSITSQQGFDKIGEYLIDNDCSNIDGANFVDPDPTTCVEAINRIADAVKGLLAGDIP